MKASVQIAILSLGLLVGLKAISDENSYRSALALVKQLRKQLSKASDQMDLADNDLDAVPLVLMYHDIEDDIKADANNSKLDKIRAARKKQKLPQPTEGEPSSDVLRTDFQDQLSWLRQNNYHTVSIDQFYAAMIDPQGHALPPKSVLLTFDDGYWGNRYLKEDLLKHTYGFGAVFFVHSHFIGAKPEIEDYEINPWAKEHMGTEELQNLAYDRWGSPEKPGDFTHWYQIESHTWSHPALDTLIFNSGKTWDGLPTNLKLEMRAPRYGILDQDGKEHGEESIPQHLSEETRWTLIAKDLKKKESFKQPEYDVKYLAYPFGRMTRPHEQDWQVMAAAQDAQYKMAFIIDWPSLGNGRRWKIHNIYAIPRMEMNLNTWVLPDDPRAIKRDSQGRPVDAYNRLLPVDAKGHVLESASHRVVDLPNFEEQIHDWKTTYRNTLLKAHRPNPKFGKGIEVETL